MKLNHTFLNILVASMLTGLLTACQQAQAQGQQTVRCPTAQSLVADSAIQSGYSDTKTMSMAEATMIANECNHRESQNQFWDTVSETAAQTCSQQWPDKQSQGYFDCFMREMKMAKIISTPIEQQHQESTRKLEKSQQEQQLRDIKQQMEEQKEMLRDIKTTMPQCQTLFQGGVSRTVCQ